MAARNQQAASNYKYLISTFLQIVPATLLLHERIVYHGLYQLSGHISAPSLGTRGKALRP